MFKGQKKVWQWQMPTTKTAWPNDGNGIVLISKKKKRHEICKTFIGIYSSQIKERFYFI